MYIALSQLESMPRIGWTEQGLGSIFPSQWVSFPLWTVRLHFSLFQNHRPQSRFLNNCFLWVISMNANSFFCVCNVDSKLHKSAKHFIPTCCTFYEIMHTLGVHACNSGPKCPALPFCAMSIWLIKTWPCWHIFIVFFLPFLLVDQRVFSPQGSWHLCSQFQLIIWKFPSSASAAQQRLSWSIFWAGKVWWSSSLRIAD